jgi:hypothetical protein
MINKTALALIAAIGAGSASAAYANDLHFGYGWSPYLSVAPTYGYSTYGYATPAPAYGYSYGYLAPAQPRAQVIAPEMGWQFGAEFDRFDVPNEQKRQFDRNAADFNS